MCLGLGQCGRRSSECGIDRVLGHLEAVRPAGPVRRRLLSAQSRRKSRSRRAERRRQDDAVPHDRRRGVGGRRRRLGAEEADHRLLPAGRRGDGAAGRCSTKRLPAADVSATCITSSKRCSTRWPIRRRPTTSIAILARFGEVQEEYDHLGGYALEAQAREVLHGLGFDDERIDGDVGALSGGWKMRVAMARVLLGRPDVLLMDEPTNHLDIESIIWLEQYLKSFAGRAAHDLARSRVHEPDRLAHRRDRRRRDHGLLGQLRLLRARARDPRGQPRGRVRAAAGDARQGAAVHRAVRRARGQGRAGAEPRQGAREDRKDRAAEEAPRREVRLPRAAAVGRPGRRRSKASRRRTAGG